MMNILKSVLLISLVFFGLGCDDKPATTVKEVIPSTALPTNLLAGEWEVSSAERNGKLTDALEGIYFNFTTDQYLTSNFNLSTEERNTSYQIEGKSLVTDSEPQQRFLIEILDTNKVVLLTKMQNFNFRLTLTPGEIAVDSLEAI